MIVHIPTGKEFSNRKEAIDRLGRKEFNVAIKNGEIAYKNEFSGEEIILKKQSEEKKSLISPLILHLPTSLLFRNEGEAINVLGRPRYEKLLRAGQLKEVFERPVDYFIE